MEARSTGSTRPSPSPQPPGAPRWVAMFYDPPSASWRQAADSPDRTPVLYAIGEMTQVKRARGDEAIVALWGPKGGEVGAVDEAGEWERFDPAVSEAVSGPETASPPTPADGAALPGASQGHAKLAERMEDRRQQVLMAGLGKAGLYDLTPDDEAAVKALVDHVDETTLRRVAHWLAQTAGTGPGGAG
ncbi:hypothetical protein ABZ725_12080 [Streptomyces sp. NPDC006872]|uniref:hypothetical protein n=1 Tax=Streptomyces sp. NPDC006872 TaxID=3155720 RepID=UPI0033D14AC6